MITQEELKSRLHYDELTGVFTWINISRGGVIIGNPAGSISKTAGYIEIGLFSKSYWAHRLVWLYIYGKFPKGQIDHIDHNRVNNSLSNLREVTNQENCRNKSLSPKNTSGVTGVFFRKSCGKWDAKIKVNQINIHLGAFNTIEEATIARKEAEVFYGFHENHGGS
jgi:hypothetical protein